MGLTNLGTMTSDGALPPPRPDDRRHASSPVPPPPPPGLIARSSPSLRRPVLIAPTVHGAPVVPVSTIRPVQPIATTAQGLVGVTVVFSLFSVFVPQGRRPAPFVEFANGMTLLFFGMAVVTVVVWLYRVASDVRLAGRRTRWSPLWAVFGWVLPPNFFVIPSLQMSELWKATNSGAASDDRSWRTGRTNIWIWTWSGLFALSYLMLLPQGVRRAGQFLNDIDWQHPENRPPIDASPLTGGYWLLSVMSTITMALAGVALIIVIHQLSRRHDELADRPTT